MLKSVITFLLLLILVISGQAQKLTTHQQLIWYAYYNTLEINEKWSVRADFQERHFINPYRQHHILMRALLIRSFGANWQGGPGFCYALQSPQDPHSTSNLVVPELRPFLEFVHKQPVGAITFLHRYNFEARYFHNSEGEELKAGYSFGSIRVRYRLGIDLSLFQSRNDKNIIKARISDELLVNIGNGITYNFFDHNRLYFALQYEPVPAISFELGYLNWFQQRNSGYEYFDRDIFRFAINHKMKL